MTAELTLDGLRQAVAGHPCDFTHPVDVGDIERQAVALLHSTALDRPY
jgi:hypothetical protein